ncbi:MAG: hypothetical protein JWP08_1147, partial [Bryobacterales bacterium]|nr:hypothetical protein [Bryobacterales bacterium]
MLGWIRPRSRFGYGRDYLQDRYFGEGRISALPSLAVRERSLARTLPQAASARSGPGGRVPPRFRHSETENAE